VAVMDGLLKPIAWCCGGAGVSGPCIASKQMKKPGGVQQRDESCRHGNWKFSAIRRRFGGAQRLAADHAAGSNTLMRQESRWRDLLVSPQVMNAGLHV